MAHTREADNDDLQFQWVKKRGIGGAKKDIQFYESFKYDDIDYSLYDCVYLYKKDEPEPYIGKIVKIWEQPDRKKKVKILWFFHPSEIQNYLGDYTPLEKEIFLASGEGVGLTNINQLEAIAGKCCVICISKDGRNPQPSKKEVEMADYIFNCTFDVGNCTISDKLADKIAGIEVKYLLNRKEDLKPNSGSKIDANGIGGHGKTDASADLLCSHANSDSLRVLENKVVNDDKPECGASSLSKDNVLEDRGLSEAKQLPDGKTVAISLNHCIKHGSSAVKVEGNHDEKKPKPSKDKVHPSLSDDRPSKKMRVVDESVQSLDEPQKNKSDTGVRKLKIESDEDDSVKDSFQLHKEAFDKMKLGVKRAMTGEAMLKCATTTMQKDIKADFQMLEVTRRPDADRSRWFKGLPWEGRVQNADEQGTLVFVDNLDPSFTSADVEDIIYISCNECCTAKVIPQVTFQNSNYGRAYVIFRAREAADLAMQKINKGCLMQPNGRPLICSKGLLKVPPKSSSLIGHLSIDKIKLQMQREEMRRAVSTSHCSQPNTIEYEMAMEWMLIQEKSVNWYRQLHKGHGEEGMQVKKSLKSK